MQCNQEKIRAGASVNAYLVLKREEQFLLLLRKNTGFCDDQYGLVSGHVEKGESATEGMIREAYEEAGITIKSENLKVVHVMHRQTERLNMDVFFECDKWEGEITNREPEKCALLEYFSPSEFPINIIDYVLDALTAISKKIFYSEKGWD